MSLFDNHTDAVTLDKETDRIILQQYKISNSGSTLIPRAKGWDNPWVNPTADNSRTYREETSIFRSMYGNNNGGGDLFRRFQDVIRGMGLPCLRYNGKFFYKINRSAKKTIKRMV